MRRLWLVAVMALACEQAKEDPVEGDAAPPGSVLCAFDDSIDPASAAELSLESPVEGFICPIEDVDWYALQVDAGARILEIELIKGSPLSPVEPTYGLWVREGEGLGALVASPRPEEVGGASLKISHCVPAGELVLGVRDLGEDNEDRRHAYTLSVTGRPDPDPTEPNDDAEAAAPLAPGAAAEGAIGCRGDEDWYAVEVGEREVLSWHLELPVAGFHPRVRVLAPGGDVLDDQRNPAATRQATDLQRVVGTRGAGTYFVVVSDDDDGEADPTGTYSLSVERLEELDPNEPNDGPTEAAALGELSCGAEWSEWVERQGSVGTLGDPDWFVLQNEGCEGGLVEVELSLDGEGLSEAAQRALQAEVQMSAALVVPDPESECAADEDCRVLNRACQNGWDCAGLFNTCLPEGRCAGASACLPQSVCGAFMLERHFQPTMDEEAPLRANRVRFAAPVSAPELFLRVADFGGDGLAPDRLYTLRVRVRREQDAHEPNNVYTPQVRRSDPVGVHLERARMVPVHACDLVQKGDQPDGGVPDAGVDAEPDAGVDAAPDAVVDAEPDAAPEPDAAAEPDAAVDAAPDAAVDAAPEPDAVVDLDLAVADAAPPVDARVEDAAPDAAPDAPEGGEPGPIPGCCGPDDWIEGAISYEGDQDFFVYAHPCPEADCMVRILFEVDGGPVEHLFQVFRGDELWYDGLIPLSEAAEQPALSGAFGGLGEADQCFYAFRGHGQRYAIGIRDLLPDHDWNPDQRYRFCVERVAEGCMEPCELFEDGCGQPSD